MLVGSETADDAGVYRLSDDLAIVQTVDYFTPVVDDPYDFGSVAAANALSDVYAMGAEPFMALNIVGFPATELDLGILHDILRGGADKCVEVGVSVVGGHSIDDKEPKFGMAVTGRVHPDRMLTNAGGKAGDLLVLTKPLGIGILTTAIKRDKLSENEVTELVALMAAVNRDASKAALEVDAHAATDVTGFGLLGHLHELASSSGLAAELWAGNVPFASDRVRALVAEKMVPGGSKKNLEYVSQYAEFSSDLAAEDPILLADAQTSGGLLLAVPEESAQTLVARLEEFKTPAAAIVGRLGSGEPGTLQVRSAR